MLEGPEFKFSALFGVKYSSETNYIAIQKRRMQINVERSGVRILSPWGGAHIFSKTNYIIIQKRHKSAD